MREVILHLKTSSTCKDMQNFPTEIIYISALLVSDGRVIDKYKTKVKPEYVDKLSKCCTQETGLTYEDLEDAPYFYEIVSELYAFLHGAKIYSTGIYDKNMLIKEISEKAYENEDSELLTRTIASNYYNLIAYYNFTFNTAIKNVKDLQRKLNVKCNNCNERNDFDVFLKIKSSLEENLSKVFTRKRLSVIIDEINRNHSQFHALQLSEHEDIIIHKSIECNKLSLLTVREFIEYWADTMIVDNQYLHKRYLSDVELDILYKQVDFHRNLSIYIQSI